MTDFSKMTPEQIERRERRFNCVLWFLICLKWGFFTFSIVCLLGTLPMTPLQGFLSCIAWIAISVLFVRDVTKSIT